MLLVWLAENKYGLKHFDELELPAYWQWNEEDHLFTSDQTNKRLRPCNEEYQPEDPYLTKVYLVLPANA